MWNKLRRQIVLWEDDTTLVVDKPAGLSVMGERHDTDLVTIASDAGEPLLWVNRIDKVTSGTVVLAKTQAAHAALTRQFARRTVDKAYLALCRPGGLPRSGVIDLPLMTARSGRVRVAAERQHITLDPASGDWGVKPDNLLLHKNYPSRTDYVRLWDDGCQVAVLALPLTGRRHQIRVHLAWVGHAIIGDPLFVKKSDAQEPRTYLHSLRVGFCAVGSGTWIEIDAPPPLNFWDPIARSFGGGSPETLVGVARDELAAHQRRLSDQEAKVGDIVVAQGTS